MNRKIFLLLAALMTQTLNSEASARPPLKPVEVYAGLSGGFNWINGRRTDSVFVPEAIPPETLYFTNGLNFRESNAQYSLFGGVSVSIPQTRIIIGPEIHVGRSHGEQEVHDFILDAPTGTSRTLSSSLSPTTYLGAVLKIGYEFFPDYIGYIVLGGEANRYKNKVTYVPQSNLGLGIGPDFRSGFFEKVSWLTGCLWGIGLEKKLNNFRLGTDIRFIDYGSFKVQLPYQASNETVVNSFKFKNIRLSLRLSYLF